MSQPFANTEIEPDPIGNSNSELSYPRLPIGRYRFVFSGDPKALPDYAGSAWRGAFGHSLKRAVCVTRLPRCPECLLYRSCAYPYIFETPPAPDSAKMRRYTAAPHPFVLQTSLEDNADAQAEHVALGVNLFGHANRHLAYVVYALQRAGAEGIGKGRAAMSLVAVRQLQGPADDWQTIYEPDGALGALPMPLPEIPSPPGVLSVRLLTPLRIHRQDSLVSEGDLTFSDLFNVLLRRISMLTYFHTDTPLETDFKGLVEQSRSISLSDKNLRWYDWTRYSSRQKTAMQMGGIIGSFSIPAAGIEAFWPYLWLGQWTHAGKGTSMGLGQYVIDTTSLPVGTSGKQ